jgi:ABC-2 type transport system ATP-binding protein
MKVRELLRFYGALKNGKDVRREADRWLERLALADWGNRKIETLSKGMSQKVQFIATVVARPELVILDEPFSGLDPVNADVIRGAILELRDAGTTVLFSTHDMSVAEKMCDFICMIFRGEKVLDGTLASIQDRYGNDTVRVRIEDDASRLAGLPHVEKVTDFGREQELRLAREADTQEILSAIVKRTRVRGFDVVRPSLHDIFVRIAGPAASEAKAAETAAAGVSA